MIDQLRAENIALIRDAQIEFSPGLTVLTGETGAGKTALLGALKLLVGERADASLVREGSEGLQVEGRFYTDDDSDGNIVRRRVSADGRGRVEIDGHMASVRELAETLGATVDLCGQHEHQQLLNPAAHLELLDAWTGEKGKRLHDAYGEALGAARAAAAELKRVQEMAQAGSDAQAQAQFVLDRIQEVNPGATELEELEAQLPRAEHAEALMRASEGAREALASDEGVCDSLSGAISDLQQASRYDEALAKWAEQLQVALLDIEDIAAQLRDYRDELEFDPDTLNQMQARMAKLQGLMRTYGPAMADVFARRDEAQELLAAASDTGERERAAKKALEAAQGVLQEAADALDELRAARAPELAARITEQMGNLEMGSAQLEVDIERLPHDQWTKAGPSHVELMYRPGAHMSARPLRRIASGGEVSRVMLACKVVLGEADKVETLVFDEVDAGVGGATAVALASVLKELARTHQVIVVTHLAQVAVMADRQYLVHKTDADVPETHIDELVGQERVEEISRMLSGDTAPASLAHAQEMLERAQG